MSSRRQRDDASRRGSRQQGQQCGRQGEVAQVVDPELGLPAGADPHQRGGHDPGVGDQQVQPVPPIGHLRGEPPDGSEIGQIHRGGGHGAGQAGECVGCLLRRSHRNQHLGPVCGQRLRRLQAQPAVAPGDDRRRAAQVDAGEYLCPGVLAGEAGLDRDLVADCHVAPRCRCARAYSRPTRPPDAAARACGPQPGRPAVDAWASLTRLRMGWSGNGNGGPPHWETRRLLTVVSALPVQGLPQ